MARKINNTKLPISNITTLNPQAAIEMGDEMKKVKKDLKVKDNLTQISAQNVRVKSSSPTY